MMRGRVTGCLLLCLMVCFPGLIAHAQTAVTPGDITVRLLQAMDGTLALPRTSPATVTASSSSSVPKGTAVVVQLAVDGAGHIAVQLVSVVVNGQSVQPKSSGGLSFAAGTRFVLPLGSSVHFTLN